MSRARRRPWGLILAALAAMAVLEIYVIIQVGQVIGPWWTIALLVAGSILGTWLVKREGSRAWRALTTALAQGRMPARELADGVLILLGGTLMLAPGFVSDVLGILCILPFTRPIGRRLLATFIGRRLVVAGGYGTARAAPGDVRDVVTGEVVEDPGVDDPGLGKSGLGGPGLDKPGER